MVLSDTHKNIQLYYQSYETWNPSCWPDKLTCPLVTRNCRFGKAKTIQCPYLPNRGLNQKFIFNWEIHCTTSTSFCSFIPILFYHELILCKCIHMHVFIVNITASLDLWKKLISWCLVFVKYWMGNPNLLRLGQRKEKNVHMYVTYWRQADKRNKKSLVL